MQAAGRAPGTRQEHHVDAVREGEVPGRLAKQPLRPVALHRTPDTTRGDDRDAWPSLVVDLVTHVEHDEIAGTLPATPEHRADVAPVPEPVVGRRAHAVRPRAWSDRDDDAG